MLLEDKTAIIYGAAGSVGSAVAPSWPGAAIRLFLTRPPRGRPRRDSPIGCRTARGWLTTARSMPLDAGSRDRATHSVDRRPAVGSRTL